MMVPFPTQVLLAEVESFAEELPAYLWFDYLRSGMDPSHVPGRSSAARHGQVVGHRERTRDASGSHVHQILVRLAVHDAF